MARMNWGEKLPSTYLETFKPVENINSRIAVLGIENLIAVQVHWVDGPKTKGYFECSAGLCCQICKPASQYYALPVWEFVNIPTPNNPGSADGILKVLKLSKTSYEALLTISTMADLNTVDLVVTANKNKGGFVTPNFFPDSRTLLSPEYRQEILAGMGDVESVLENTVAKKATQTEWMQIAMELQASSFGPQGLPSQQPMAYQANPAQVFGSQGSFGQVAGMAPGQRALPQGQPVQAQQPAFHQPQAPAQPRPAQFQQPQAQQPIGAPTQPAARVFQQPQAPVNAKPQGVAYSAPAPSPFARPVQPAPGFAQPAQEVPMNQVAEQVMSEDEMAGLLGQS